MFSLIVVLKGLKFSQLVHWLSCFDKGKKNILKNTSFEVEEYSKLSLHVKATFSSSFARFKPKEQVSYARSFIMESIESAYIPKLQFTS